MEGPRSRQIVGVVLQGLSYLAKAFSWSVSVGIGSQKGVLRFLGEGGRISGQGRRPRISKLTTGLAGSMDKLLFWLGIGAAQKGAGSKSTKDRHPVVSVVVGILIAVLIAVGVFILLVSQQ